MIGDWLAQAPLLGMTLLVVFLPGLLIGAGLRLRGLTLWASAPGITIGLLALLAIGYPFLGIRWGHLSAGIGVVLAAGIVWGVAALVGRDRWSHLPRATRRPWGWMLLGGLVVGGGLNAARLMTYVGVPTAISQTNDAVFHLNALRWIAETGSASSLTVSGLVGGGTFYPAAWHAVASLVAFDNAQIPVAANLVSLVTAAVIWPTGVALLARMLTGDRVVTVLAAALSAGLMAFPQLMFEWGVLYPYALSLAVVPSGVAVTIMIVRVWQGAAGSDRWRGIIGFASAAVLLVVAITLSQPSTVLVWAVLVMLWLTGSLLRGHAGRPRAAAVVVTIIGWVLVLVAWLVLSYLAGSVLWRSYRSVLGALSDVVLNSHSLLPPAIGMSALMIVGLVAGVRNARLRWLVIAWAGVSFLYVIAVGTDLPVFKRILTGAWYGDSFRIAAIVPVIVVPLAAIGLAALLRLLARRGPGFVRGRLAGLTASSAAVIAVIGTVAIAITPVVLLRVAADTDEQSRYTMNSRSYLSSDEHALLSGLPESTPADAVLIGNPSTGVAFAYVLGQREVIPRTWAPPQSQAWDVLAASMNDAADDPAVCDALAAYGSPGYVLDFGPGSTGPGQYVMPGMTGFDGRDGFELVERVGDATLWRITACG